MDQVRGAGPWTRSMELVHGPGPLSWSMDQVHGVVHRARSMFCIRPLISRCGYFEREMCLNDYTHLKNMLKKKIIAQA